MYGRKISAPLLEMTKKQRLLREAVVTAIRSAPVRVSTLLAGLSLEDRHAVLGIGSYATGHGNDIPLHVAIISGRFQVVRLLIGRYKVSVEQEATLDLAFRARDLRHDATPIWLAYACQQWKIFRLLLRYGANANSTKGFTDGQRLLNKASYEGKLNVVKTLLRRGAMVNALDFAGNSSLMSVILGFRTNTLQADSKARLAIIRALIKHGARTNVTDSSKQTLLHVAAVKNFVGAVKHFVKVGVPAYSEDVKGFTPAMTAAAEGHYAVVDFLSSLPDCPVMDRVVANELLGAVLVVSEQRYHMGFYYMRVAMLLRDEHGIRKPAQQGPENDFFTEQECQTAQELELLNNDRVRMLAESAYVIERMLKNHNLLTLYYTSIVASSLLALQNNLVAIKLLLRIAEREHYVAWMEKMCEIIYHWCMTTPSSLDSAVFNVLKKTLQLLHRKASSQPMLHFLRMSHVYFRLHQVLGLIKVITTRSFGSEDDHQLRGLVYLLCRQNLRDHRGRSLLHYAVAPRLSGHATYEVAQLLIDCGHDVNCADNDGNTVVHVAVQYHCPLASRFVDILAASGAHLDYVNKERNTPLNCCSTQSARNSLARHLMPRLTCLAARAVARSGLEYRSHIPCSLHAFVSRH